MQGQVPLVLLLVAAAALGTRWASLARTETIREVRELVQLLPTQSQGARAHGRVLQAAPQGTEAGVGKVAAFQRLLESATEGLLRAQQQQQTNGDPFAEAVSSSRIFRNVPKREHSLRSAAADGAAMDAAPSGGEETGAISEEESHASELSESGAVSSAGSATPGRGSQGGDLEAAGLSDEGPQELKWMRGATSRMPSEPHSLNPQPLLSQTVGASSQAEQALNSHGRHGTAVSLGEQGLCWSTATAPDAQSASLDLSLPGGQQQPSPSRGGIVVHGQGCRGTPCDVGQLCAFTIVIEPPLARWHTTSNSSFSWDLMVTLRGPALGHADVTRLLGADFTARVFTASFRMWDPGMYRVYLRAPCLNLWFPGRNARDDAVGEWDVAVTGEPPASAESSGDAFPSALTSAASRPPGRLASPHPSPCSLTVQARWLLVEGQYRWTPFPCAPAAPATKEMPSLLVHKKGIREINFVGDSRLRVMMLHMYHLFMAGEQNSQESTYPYHLVQKHGNLTLKVPIAQAQETDAPLPGESVGGRAELHWPSLTLNFYFSDFISADGEFGCRRGSSAREPGWRPEVSPTADLTVVNAGSWTGAFCTEPELAVLSHLREALDWAASHKGRPGATLVFRSASTMYRAMGCRATNSFLRFSNSVAQALCPAYGAHYFNSWEVEAPRFSDTCSSHDHHYSCFRMLKGGGAAMRGDVGEAVVQSFLHFIYYAL